MEPMTMTATAIGTLLLVKIGEGAATEAGKKLFEKVEKLRKLISKSLDEKAKELLRRLRMNFPDAAKDIEEVQLSSFDMDKIEFKLNEAIEKDKLLADVIEEVDNLVKQEPELYQGIKELVEELKPQSPRKHNYNNNIGKVVNLLQGESRMDIREQNNNL